MKLLKLLSMSILIVLGSLLNAAKDRSQNSKHRNENNKSKNHRTNPADSPQDEIPFPQSLTTQPTTEDKQWDKQERLWERQIRVNVILNWITLGTAIVGLYGLLILNETLKATQIAAKAAESQVKSTERATRIAEDTFKHTVETFRLDQRAWVAPIEVITPILKVGASPTFGFLISNTGKTPALRHRNIVVYRVLPKEQKFVADYPNIKSSSTSAILPGARMGISVPSERIVTQADIEELRTGAKILYVYGQLFYDDVFKQSHYTRFCVYLHTDLSSFQSCDTYNDAN
jgi:hypothetical protein